VFLVDLPVHVLKLLDEGSRGVPAEERSRYPAVTVTECEGDRIFLLVQQEPAFITARQGEGDIVPGIGQHRELRLHEYELVHAEDLGCFRCHGHPPRSIRIPCGASIVPSTFASSWSTIAFAFTSPRMWAPFRTYTVEPLSTFPWTTTPLTTVIRF